MAKIGEPFLMFEYQTWCKVFLKDLPLKLALVFAGLVSKFRHQKMGVGLIFTNFDTQQKEPKGRIGKTRRQKVGVVVLVSLRRWWFRDRILVNGMRKKSNTREVVFGCWFSSRMYWKNRYWLTLVVPLELETSMVQRVWLYAVILFFAGGVVNAAYHIMEDRHVDLNTQSKCSKGQLSISKKSAENHKMNQIIHFFLCLWTPTKKTRP